MRHGETIRLEASTVPTRNHSNELSLATAQELVSEKGSWQLELQLGPEAGLLLSLFETMHSWLVEDSWPR